MPYKNFPLWLCVSAVERIVKNGHTVFQKWTCEGCGRRVTGVEPNAMCELGHCDECGHNTNLLEAGCNYSVRAVVKLEPCPPGVDAMEWLLFGKEGPPPARS